MDAIEVGLIGALREVGPVVDSCDKGLIGDECEIEGRAATSQCCLCNRFVARCQAVHGVRVEPNEDVSNRIDYGSDKVDV